MVAVVIPFAGTEGKTRLHPEPGVRGRLAVAMLLDVLAACREVGRTRVVTPDEDLIELDWVEVVADPGTGQGSAVAAALAGVSGPIVVLNADLPAVTSADIRALAETAPALVAAVDGTTNALSLPSAELFAPLYGPGSAARFEAHLNAAGVAIPNLVDDVDTPADLARLEARLGSHTRTALGQLERCLA